MKASDRGLKEILADGMLIVFFLGTIGIALKFATFFNHWVYLSSFPNALDSTFLILASSYFIYIMFKKRCAEK